MKPSRLAIGLLAAFFVAQFAMSRFVVYDKWKANYMPKSVGIQATGLDPGQFLAAMAGFREMIAGILWVRADSFFDTGNYDAILPIIRLVTWLDPHQIDVYATGMWHIGYNFTDEESRSDRRYIPSALALGKEGARQNSHTYEMFFETGWMWYHKIDDDYDKAVYWFQEAHERPDILPARKNLLANAYERNGEIEKALELRYKLLDDAQKRFDQDQAFQSRQLRDRKQYRHAARTHGATGLLRSKAEGRHRPVHDLRRESAVRRRLFGQSNGGGSESAPIRRHLERAPGRNAHSNDFARCRLPRRQAGGHGMGFPDRSRARPSKGPHVHAGRVVRQEPTVQPQGRPLQGPDAVSVYLGQIRH
jgi:hypothetical protein